MSYTSRLLVVVVCLFVCLAVTAPARAQGSPTVYYSTGPTSPSQIYSLTSSTPLVSTSAANADWESLVVGPTLGTDYQLAGMPAQAFLLYACDPQRNVIIRFDPNNLGAGQDTVSTAVPQPVCGRFTSTGSLIVDGKTGSSKSGSGVWEINGLDASGNVVGIAALPLRPFSAAIQQCPKGAKVGPCVLPPQQISLTVTAGTTPLGSGWGLATKNVGDELIVDGANGQILRLSYPFSVADPISTLSTFVGPNMVTGAVGIARSSAGNVFVSTQGKKPAISEFDSQGNFVGSCAALPNGNWTPNFLQISLDDTLYAGLSANNKGEILAINSNSCNSTPQSFALSVPAVGIALPPTAAPLQPAQPQSTPNGVMYAFSLGDNAAFQLTAAATCNPTPTATAEELTPPAIQTLIGTIGIKPPTYFGATPVPDLWADGFEIGFDLSASGCTPLPGSSLAEPPGFGELLAVQVDNQLASNPEVLACDGGTCSVVQSFGVYPLGGILPQDGNYTGRGGTSLHFLVNGDLTTTLTEQGTFCGFQSPLLQTGSNGFATGIAGPFSSGQNLAVKFKLAEAAPLGSCKNGPYITDATALVSVAEIQPTFQIINIDSSGNSTPIMPPTPLTIKADNNNQYQLSLSLQGYNPGIYTLTITFLTNNTIQQTVEFQVQ